jgi:hypothetical protein
VFTSGRDILQSPRPTGLFDDKISFVTSTGGTFAINVHGAVTAPSDYAFTILKTGESGRPNSNPIAVDDAATVVAGQATVIRIGDNDSDADNEPLITAVGLRLPTKGTVSYTDNSPAANTLIYTSFETATGTDSLDYAVCDGNGGKDFATVTITISSGNRNPVALDDTAITTAGQAVIINIGSNDSDANGHQLSTIGVSGQEPL